MTPECDMDSYMSLILISLIGVAAFDFGFLAGLQSRNQGADRG